jgi:hypothetical protein
MWNLYDLELSRRLSIIKFFSGYQPRQVVEWRKKPLLYIYYTVYYILLHIQNLTKQYENYYGINNWRFVKLTMTWNQNCLKGDKERFYNKVRFKVKTSFSLKVKEIQFHLLSTTLLIFSAAHDEDMNNQCGPQVEDPCGRTATPCVCRASVATRVRDCNQKAGPTTGSESRPVYRLFSLRSPLSRPIHIGHNNLFPSFYLSTLWSMTTANRPDDGDSKDLWNVGKLLPDYTALQPRRQPSSNLGMQSGFQMDPHRQCYHL